MDRKNKIEPFYINDRMLEDPDMDELLKKSIIEEADKIEEELNSDPALQGIGASDDMFELIKARLRAQGVWEEDDEIANQHNAFDKKIIACENKADTEIAEKNEKEIEIIEEEQEKDKPVIQETTYISEEGKEGIETESAETENTDAYSFLSKEDREALELGKKVKKQRKKRWKQLIAAAAAMVIVFSAGMSGEASKRWILETWDKFTTAAGLRVRTNYVEEGTSNNAYYNIEEQNAWNDIKEKMGVPGLWFNYLPEGVVFSDYEILSETKEAHLFYTCEDKVLTVKIVAGNNAASFYAQSDMEPLLCETIINDLDIAIEIWDTTTKGIESYQADFVYQDCTFVFSGKFAFEEFEQIVKCFYII